MIKSEMITFTPFLRWSLNDVLSRKDDLKNNSLYIFIFMIFHLTMYLKTFRFVHRKILYRL